MGTTVSLQKSFLRHTSWTAPRKTPPNQSTAPPCFLDTLPITNINKEYSVSLELPQDLPETARYDIFTDGSLQKREKTNLTGAGFTISRNGNTVAETSISLGQQATINQCEMMAIYRAAETMLGLSPRNEGKTGSATVTTKGTPRYPPTANTAKTPRRLQNTS